MRRTGLVRILCDRHPGVVVGVREDGRTIVLDRLIVAEDRRGRGVGSAVMRDVVGYADRHAKEVELTPSGAFGGSPRRLAAFYARFGFVGDAGCRRMRRHACRLPF